MSVVEDAVTFAHERRDDNLNQYIEVLSIPSVSTLSEHKPDVERMGRWMADELTRLGMSRVEICPTPGHPVVYGEWLGAEGKPTVLVYGHYDVQPVDPLNEWDSPPFEPAVRGDYIYARGASDMKGQIFAQLKALEALVQDGPLNFNIKYLLEGEEEVGSPNLGTFIDEHKDMLACDFVLNCDAGIHAPDEPSIVYALRGLAYFELEVKGPARDLHSGQFGGAIPNPAHVLAELVAKMHDEKGRVTLPGFYDKVRPLSDEERETMAKVRHSDAEFLEFTGAKALYGEEGFTTVERVGARPTLDVNGMWSGFTGEGSKTVLPAKATAKISMRLVPDQQPGEAHGQLVKFLETHAPDCVTWNLREMVHGPGAVMDRTTHAMAAAVNALETVFGQEVHFIREGGSVPVVGMLKEKLGVDSVMLGFALPDDGIHGPNERQYLPNFYRGIETYIHFMASL